MRVRHNYLDDLFFFFCLFDMGSDDAFVFSSYQRQNVCSLSLNGFGLMEILYACISIPSSSCSVKTAVSMWIHTFTAVCNNCRFYFLCLQSLYISFFIDFFPLTVIPLLLFVCPVGVVPLLASDHCVGNALDCVMVQMMV